MIFEEASAHILCPNTCPAIPVESIHCLWVLVWPALHKAVDWLHNPGQLHQKPSTHYTLNATLDHSTFILEYFRDGLQG